MLKWIDRLLNQVTMYRLVLFVLLALLALAEGFSLFGWLPINPLALLFSVFFLTALCVLVNELGGKIFHAPLNTESAYITALILALIISPSASPWDLGYFSLAIWASVLAMMLKYVFAIGNKHVFNPVAIAVAATVLALNQSASWWVGTRLMMPFVLIGGLLIVKKIRRFDLVGAFFAAALVSIVGSGWMRGVNVASLLTRTILETPILFFASVMLTEPLTTPPTRARRILYGGVVGGLFAPWVHVGSIYSTPEIALVVGNVLSYLLSPKAKFVMRLKERQTIADQSMDFLFHPPKPLAYKPGQYMEWTLAHKDADLRGNRRYFTLASSPTEEDLRLGIKFYPKGSSFKRALQAMSGEDVIVGAQLAGDFVLPDDSKKKLVFIAGGIGVTPFRSMIKYLVDRKESRDIVHFYANRTYADIAYQDVFEAARKELGIKTVYVVGEKTGVPPVWNGCVGIVNGEMIQREVPDYKERTFFISGPHGMIEAFKKTLKQMGVPASRIKTDFFPGFA